MFKCVAFSVPKKCQHIWTCLQIWSFVIKFGIRNFFPKKDLNLSICQFCCFFKSQEKCQNMLTWGYLSTHLMSTHLIIDRTLHFEDYPKSRAVVAASWMSISIGQEETVARIDTRIHHTFSLDFALTLTFLTFFIKILISHNKWIDNCLAFSWYETRN